MCTIAILFRATDVPLVVAANRDEPYARPTRPPEVIGPAIVGGVDALSGGTWLAVNLVTAFIASVLVIRPFLGVVRRSGFVPFASYRIIIGLGLLAAIAAGWL